MMVINGLSDASQQAGPKGMGNAADPVSRGIEQQIANAKKQLQELSSNTEMSMEEKMNKRQEIQKQIADLNNQLRQHQIALRKEKQQEQTSSKENTSGGKQAEAGSKSKEKAAGLSQTSMQAIISGDAAVSQAKVQGSAAAKMEGRANVLKAEIKQDAALGGNTEAKQEELAEAEQAAMQAQSAQMNTLGEANKQMKETLQKEQPEGSTEDKKETDDAAWKDKKEHHFEENADTENTAAARPSIRGYNPIDVQL